MPRTALVWFRRDLRLADNPALAHAVGTYDRVVPVFVWAPTEAGDWPPGGAHRWYLHHSLKSLDAALRAKGSRLILRQSASLDALRGVLDETGAEAVFWNRRYEPAIVERDARVMTALRSDGCDVLDFEGYLLHDPDAIRTGAGTPYQVFTPFWKSLQTHLEVRDPLPVPRMGETKAPDVWPRSEPLESLHLLPEKSWDAGFYDVWTPGEATAQERLAAFTEHALIDYATARNDLAADGTSRLSMRLHWGELSARQVWQHVRGWQQNGAMKQAADAFLREVAWREFAYHLLHHFPHTTGHPLKEKFAGFPWEDDPDALEKWQRGQTGFPVVDAGMRQLWQTGWMHNRARLVVASFLTKDLLLPWQKGARWFWDTLIDGDLANNTLNWQWSAGSGADAQPFFRIFNPVSQSKKFDPDGDYIRRWVPELAALPTRHLHAPWEAPADVLRKAGVTLGETYPRPLVEHKAARARALEAFAAIK